MGSYYVANFFRIQLQLKSAGTAQMHGHPYIIRLYDGDRPTATYKIFVEQEDLARCYDLATALYIMFAYHYIFNISYHTRAQDVLLFLQEMVLCMTLQNQKKSAAYLSST